jgi:type VI secretion system secreted protein Hcp
MICRAGAVARPGSAGAQPVISEAPKEKTTMPEFLSVKGIGGESGNAKHKAKGVMDAIDYEWGVSHGNNGVPGTHSDQAGGRAMFGTLKVLKYLDAATPLLMQACASGQKIDDAEFIIDDTDQNQTTLVVYKLEGVRVQSVKNRKARAEDVPPGITPSNQPLEWVELRYAQLTITATKLDRTNTSAGGWNLIENKKK